MKRDFTYIDDIVDGIVAILDVPPEKTKEETPHRVLNLGNTHSENLMDFIHLIENGLDKKADIDFQGMQAGDVKETYADITETTALTGYTPKITIKEGVPRFIAWYKDYYGTTPQEETLQTA